KEKRFFLILDEQCFIDTRDSALGSYIVDPLKSKEECVIVTGGFVFQQRIETFFHRKERFVFNKMEHRGYGILRVSVSLKERIRSLLKKLDEVLHNRVFFFKPELLQRLLQ